MTQTKGGLNPRWTRVFATVALVVHAGWTPSTSLAADAAPAPCHLSGISYEALCGVVKRPLDPEKPDGTLIDVHYAVLPSVARNKKRDPVFFFAGGPGQSAISLAPTVAGMLGRFGNRRDLVLIDQRGTGRSAPLLCEQPDRLAPLSEQFDPQRPVARLRACLESLARTPHGDLRHYTTVHATRDVEAVRVALGVERINLLGMSYGTRPVLDYLRQHPQRVRSAVIDGVAPPDQALPASSSGDAQVALDAALASCDEDPECRARMAPARARWEALLASLPRTVTLVHPVTGLQQTVTLHADTLRTAVRWPLYAPLQTSALPAALDEAAQGRFQPLMALAGSLGGASSRNRTYEGMHFAVMCAEDMPRMDRASDAPGRDFGDSFLRTYRDVCAQLPSAQVPASFYEIPASPAPVLLLSGGLDPVTPPRHGERVARLLGPKAVHVVVPHAGHGVMSVPCMRDAVFRFVDGVDEPRAPAADLSCAGNMPRPRPYLPPRPAAPPSSP